MQHLRNLQAALASWDACMGNLRQLSILRQLLAESSQKAVPVIPRPWACTCATVSAVYSLHSGAKPQLYSGFLQLADAVVHDAMVIFAAATYMRADRLC